MIKFYSKNIAESRNIIYIVTIIAFLLRWFSFISTEDIIQYENILLWNIVSPLLDNKYVSFFSAFFLSVGIAFYLELLNNRHALIRRRTSLPYVFTIFSLSCFPSFIHISPAYFGIITLLFSINMLFNAYQNPYAAKNSFQVGFLLALGSLFSPIIIVYLLLFWIGFSLMRSFNVKIVLASLLGVGMVYWLAFIYYYYSGLNIKDIFVDLTEGNYIKPFSYLIYEWKSLLFMIFNFLAILFVIIHQYTHSFNDKIQTRANIAFLDILLIFSFLAFCLLNRYTEINLIIALSTGSLVLAHYFALVSKKREIYFFYGFVILYLISYLYSLLKYFIERG